MIKTAVENLLVLPSSECESFLHHCVTFPTKTLVNLFIEQPILDTVLSSNKFALYINVAAVPLSCSQLETKMKTSSRLLFLVLILISFAIGNCIEENQTSTEPKKIEMMPKTLYLTKVCTVKRF